MLIDHETSLPPLSDDGYWLEAIKTREFDDLSAETLVELARAGLSDVSAVVETRVLNRLCAVAQIVAQPLLGRNWGPQRRWDVLQTTFDVLTRSLRAPTSPDCRALATNFAARVARFVVRARDDLRVKQDGASHAAPPADERTREPRTRFSRRSRLNDREMSDAGASAEGLADDRGSAAEQDPEALLLLAEALSRLPDKATRRALMRRMTGGREPDAAGRRGVRGKTRGPCSWADAGRPFGISGQTLQNRVEAALRDMDVERRRRDKEGRVGAGRDVRPPGEKK